MEERQHHLRESSSAGLRRSQKLEILPSPNSKSLDAYICGRQHFRPPTSFIGRGDFNWRLATVVNYETRTIFIWRRHFMYAQILLGRRYFMGANISWAQTFHGRKHFMGANISWAQTFHGREYFMGANISWARIYFMGANISWVPTFQGR